MIASASAVIDLLQQIVRLSRTGNYAAASSLLNRCILLMQSELTKGTIQSALLARAAALLDELFKAQKRNDWVAFADTIEYSLIDFWRENFSAPC
jgi:hypothetical protein